MANTKHRPADLHAAPGPLPEAHALTLAEEREANDIEREHAFDAARALGQIEALQFSATVAGRAQVEIYLNLKKSKSYRAITYRDADGNPRRVADLEEFCERYLGKSARRMQEMVQQYHLLGGELYEAAERIGFRNQDYRALKALPDDDQETIRQAIASDDRDTVLNLMQELAARHQSEKTALEKRATEAEETAEARDQVIRAKTEQVDRLHEDNAKLTRRVAAATPDEIGEQLRAEVSDAAFAAEAAVRGALRLGFEALASHAAQHGVTHENFMAGCLAQVEAALLELRGGYDVNLRPDADPRPDWTRDGFDADAAVDAAIGDDLAAFKARMASAN